MQYSGAQALSSGSIITHLQKGILIRIEIPAERGQVFTGTPHGITSKEINPSSIRNVSATSSKVSSSVASRTESELISSEKATQRNRNFSMTPQLSREYTMPRVASISKSSQITEQETSQLQKQTLTQKQWTGIRLITPQETVTEPLALRMTGNITRRPNTQVIGVGGAEGKKESSFFAEVRRKKKFFTLGTFETKESAVKAGQTSVLTSAAASFRVSGAHGVLSFQEIGRPESMNKAFYASAKEKGVVIQKRETRISSPGEKKEITYKGLNILRMRRR